MIKHWAPIPEIRDYLKNRHSDATSVLEVGPGSIPFPLATHFVDHLHHNPNTVIVDINNTCLPYSYKQFDFVYCRHVLEDIQNPDFAFNELVRVAKSGYIETPSPIVEVTRGVDGGDPFYRGYIHHRSLVWEKDGVLHFLPKFPIIEHLTFQDMREILKDPYMWNTYYYWDEKSNPGCKVLKYDVDYKIHINYQQTIIDGCNAAYTSIKSFSENFLNPTL